MEGEDESQEAGKSTGLVFWKTEIQYDVAVNSLLPLTHYKICISSFPSLASCFPSVKLEIFIELSVADRQS